MKLDQYLQQLPLSSDKKGLIDLPPAKKEQAWQIVWEAFLTGDFQQRWEVAKYLPKFGDRAIAPLTTLLQTESANLDLRCEAAALLSKFNQANAIFALTEVLNAESETELTTACANALAQMGKRAIPTLTAALSNPDTRFSAVQALAYLHHPEIISPLIEVADDPNPDIRSTVMATLSNFRDSQGRNVLISGLQDTHSSVRKEAVIGLGVRGKENPETVVSVLIPLLSDFNLEVCSHCAIALGKIGTSQAIHALGECLQSPLTPSPLKQQIIRSFSHQETEPTLVILASSLNEQPPPIQTEIIAVLGRWKQEELKPTVAETLIQFFQELPEAQKSSNLKQGLAVALGNLNVPSGKPLLEKLAGDESAIVKLHAKAALKKLLI